MKNLGRISLLLIVVLNMLYAKVTARVEPSSIYAGETATYSLNITGEDIKKPVLYTLCGNSIISTGSQTSIQSINGKYNKSYNLTYQFTPTASCTIDAISLEIDGEVQKSNSVKVEVKPMKQDLNADFLLSLELSKNELYVGEPFELTLYLKQKHGAEVVDSKFIAPTFKGFWVKGESKPQRSDDGTYVITKMSYKLAAQREGNLSISPAQIQIATRVGVNSWGGFMPQVRWRTYYSNAINIQTKALPNDAKIVGDFTINAKVVKSEVNPNEAVNVTVELVGEGNLEDIESFKPYVKDVNIFDEKIVINGNKLTQKLVFVSESDFSIPAFTLEYFDIKSKTLKIISTKAINIKVKGEQKKSEVKITRDENAASKKPQEVKIVTKSADKIWIILAFVIGLLIGIFSMLIKRRASSKKTKKLDLKDEKLLLVKFLPFKDEGKDVQSIVDILEKNLYSKNREEIDKKLLKEIIQKYKIN